MNEAGRQAVASVNAEEAEGNPVAFLELAGQLPDGTVACFLQADAWIAEPPVIQGVWNLRDPYKTSRRMLVLLGAQIRPPVSLQRDVVALDEELPDREALTRIVRELDQAASEATPDRPSADDELVRRSAEAVQGLSAFLAEQAVAMALRRDGIDLDHLWDNRRTMIEQTRGLSVDREPITFNDVGGLAQIKDFGRALFEGPHPPSVVVRIEEIEKVMAGSQGDLSGTSQDALQVVLNSMEDYGWASRRSKSGRRWRSSVRSAETVFSALPRPTV